MIQIGQRVYSGLHGGHRGVVFAIRGEQRPESVGRMLGGVVGYGGSAEFDIVFENGTETHRLPESILYGVQWEIYPEVVRTEEISFWRDHAASEKARKDDEAKKQAEQFSATVTALINDPRYQALKKVNGPFLNCAKLVACNIRIELKAAFPGVKFSVRCDGSNSVRIGWTDGPTTHQVGSITSKYSAGHFDGMEDIYKHRRSPWTVVFGSVMYVNEERDYSVETMTKAVEFVSTEYGWSQIEVMVSSVDHSAYCKATDHDQERVVYEYLERSSSFEHGAV